MKKHFVILLCLFSFACTKEKIVEVQVLPDCEKNLYGLIFIKCLSTNPYNVYIDDQFIGTVDGGKTTDGIKVKEGLKHKIYALQKSGYLFYPTEVTLLKDVTRCLSQQVNIP